METLKTIRIGNEDVPCDSGYWSTAKNVARATVRYMRAVTEQQVTDGYDSPVPIHAEVFTSIMGMLTPVVASLADHYGRPQDEVQEQLQLLIADGALFRNRAAAA